MRKLNLSRGFFKLIKKFPLILMNDVMLSNIQSNVWNSYNFLSFFYCDKRLTNSSNKKYCIL